MKLSRSKLITCDLPKGTGRGLVEKLKSECGLITSDMNFARGMGKISSKRGRGEYVEKEIVTVMVPDDRADDIFSFIYHEAGVNKAHGGFMYMHALHKSVPYSLPDLPEENSE